MTTPETQLKSAVKELFEVFNIFSFPVLQGIGAYRGMPDRIVHVKGRVHYIEFKQPKGKLSKHQENFKAQCEADGIHYHVIRSIGEAVELVNEWREAE